MSTKTSSYVRGERERKPIEKIREALGRIEEGTYGFCEGCGDEISEKRVIALRVTALCIDCKTSQEEDKRRGGTSMNRLNSSADQGKPRN
jgi:RNA polymerase-binding transcription factor DksA